MRSDRLRQLVDTLRAKGVRSSRETSWGWELLRDDSDTSHWESFDRTGGTPPRSGLGFNDNSVDFDWSPWPCTGHAARSSQ